MTRHRVRNPPAGITAAASTTTATGLLERRRNGSSRGPVQRPKQGMLQILIEAFKHDYERTLTYKESELFAWICKVYPYYATQNPEFWQPDVKKTLDKFECFRNVGRNTWTYMDQKAVTILRRLQQEKDETTSDESSEAERSEPDTDSESGLAESPASLDTSAEVTRAPTDGRLKHNRSIKSRRSTKRIPRKRKSRSLRYSDDSDEQMSSSTSPPTPPPDDAEEDDDNDDIVSQSSVETIKVDSADEMGNITPDASSMRTVISEKHRCPSGEEWEEILTRLFTANGKQRTIRDIVSWAVDNYPEFHGVRSQLDDSALEFLKSNKKFCFMSRGRWCMKMDEDNKDKSSSDDDHTMDVDQDEPGSSADEDDGHAAHVRMLKQNRRHSVTVPVRRNAGSKQRKFRKKTKSLSYHPSETPLNYFDPSARGIDGMSVHTPTFQNEADEMVTSPITPVTPSMTPGGTFSTVTGSPFTSKSVNAMSMRGCGCSASLTDGTPPTPLFDKSEASLMDSDRHDSEYAAEFLTSMANGNRRGSMEVNQLLPYHQYHNDRRQYAHSPMQPLPPILPLPTFSQQHYQHQDHCSLPDIHYLHDPHFQHRHNNHQQQLQHLNADRASASPMSSSHPREEFRVLSTKAERAAVEALALLCKLPDGRKS